MDTLPSNVSQRLAALRGAHLVLLYEPYGRARVSLFLHPPGQPPLTITLDGIREARWPFAFYPSLRIPYRFASVARDVRFAMSKSFVTQGPRQSARIEVDLEGAASLVFEAEGVTIGPLGPVAPPPPPPTSIWS